MYEKQEWIGGKTGTPATPERMNHLEEGIYENSQAINGQKSMESIIVEDIECKNIFDKNDVVNGYRFGSDGLLFADANYSATDYIAVKPNTTYIANWTLETRECICYYDSSFNFISRNVSVNPFTTPSNCKYIRASILTTNLNIAQIEKGDTATPYTPFKEFDNRPKLLWKNPAPSTTFATQDITLSSSDYNMLIWIFDTYVFSGLSESEMSLKGFGVRTSISNGTGTAFITRTITRNSDTSFTVGSGYNDGTVDENSLIPRVVYGFKTSQLSSISSVSTTSLEDEES